MIVHLEQVNAADWEFAGANAKPCPFPGDVGAVVEDRLGLHSWDGGLSTLAEDKGSLVGEDWGGRLYRIISMSVTSFFGCVHTKVTGAPANHEMESLKSTKSSESSALAFWAKSDA